MHIKSLQLVNFKNYAQAELEFSPELNCLTGKNAGGKTTIIDAIHYLSVCRSYLNPIDSQNIKFGEGFFILQSFWEKEGREVELHCAVKKGQKKILKRNKVNYEKLADHIGEFPVVMISPYDRNLISEGSEERRKWMDSIISQFDRNYLESLMRYNKILEQRNALLKHTHTPQLLERENFDVWDEQLAALGTKIAQKRSAFLTDFIPLFQHHYQFLGVDSEKVNLIYKSQLSEVDFLELLKGNRKRDMILGYTSVGIHKDDLLFEMNENPIKKFGSQGQQKSYLIALKLAQYDCLKHHLSQQPVLLLDDIFDKLDQRRVARLMQLVSKDDFGQVFITDTDEKRLSEILHNLNKEIAFFRIENAQLEKYDYAE